MDTVSGRPGSGDARSTGAAGNLLLGGGPPTGALAGASSSGDSGYRPSRDPTVVLLVLIILGALVAAVAGVGPGDVVGGDDDQTTVGDGDATTEPTVRPALEVNANESEVRVGDRVEFSVRTGNGPVENAVVSAGDRTVRTGTDGTAVLALDRPGRISVTADPPDDRYAEGSTQVRVRRHEVALSVRIDRTQTVTARTVRVRVERPNGSPVAATVLAGQREVATGPDGVANVSFATAGEYNVTARKARTRRERFTATTATVAVARRPVALAIATNDTDVLVDERLSLNVTRVDTGARVNATLVARETPRHTGDDGRLTVAFDRAGRYAVRANASPTPAVRFRPAERTVAVGRRVAGLELSVAPTPVRTGENVTVVLRRTDTGERTSGAVRVDGDRYRVGDDGTLSLAVADPGQVSLDAEKPPTRTHRFRPDTARVLVLGPSFVVTNLTAPDRVAVGTTYRVSATVRNEGNHPGNATVSYRRNDTTVATTRVGLDPNGESTVRFVLEAPEGAGTFRQAVVAGEGSASARLRVTRPNGTAPAVGAASDQQPGRTGRDRIDRPIRRYGLRNDFKLFGAL